MNFFRFRSWFQTACIVYVMYFTYHCERVESRYFSA